VLVGVKMIDIDLTHVLVKIFHPEEALPIKIEGHRVLVELKLTFSIGLKNVLLEVRHIDRWQRIVRQPSVLLIAELDRDHAIEVHKVEGERSLTVLLMSSIIWVVDDLPEVHRVEGFSVKALARDVTDGDEDAFPVLGM
jgi:hypothetical protein